MVVEVAEACSEQQVVLQPQAAPELLPDAPFEPLPDVPPLSGPEGEQARNNAAAMSGAGKSAGTFGIRDLGRMGCVPEPVQPRGQNPRSPRECRITKSFQYPDQPLAEIRRSGLPTNSCAVGAEIN
jgi:hypothetical protein